MSILQVSWLSIQTVLEKYQSECGLFSPNIICTLDDVCLGVKLKNLFDSLSYLSIFDNQIDYGLFRLEPLNVNLVSLNSVIIMTKYDEELDTNLQHLIRERTSGGQIDTIALFGGNNSAYRLSEDANKEILMPWHDTRYKI